MNVRALFSFAVLGSVLIGCGGGSSKQTALAVSPLAGNWLITGPMPTVGFTAPGTGVFSLASGYGSGFCASASVPPVYDNAFSFGSLTTGVIAADGSFTLQTPPTTPIYSLSVQGKVPAMNAEQFAGTYAAGFNSTIARGCVGNSAGSFTATYFPIVSGVYSGAGEFQSFANGVSTATPVTIELTLHQGAPVLDPKTGIAKPSNIAIGGSISVKGFPCFTTGTASTIQFGPTLQPSSSIQGNIMIMNFTMDDGTMLSMNGALTDATENHISAFFAVDPFVQGCGAGAIIIPAVDLTRQT
jgi:hypothetical protein